MGLQIMSCICEYAPLTCETLFVSSMILSVSMFIVHAWQVLLLLLLPLTQCGQPG